MALLSVKTLTAGLQAVTSIERTATLINSCRLSGIQRALIRFYRRPTVRLTAGQPTTQRAGYGSASISSFRKILGVIDGSSLCRTGSSKRSYWTQCYLIAIDVKAHDIIQAAGSPHNAHMKEDTAPTLGYTDACRVCVNCLRHWLYRCVIRRSWAIDAAMRRKEQLCLRTHEPYPESWNLSRHVKI